jgi:hypothetical protein
VRLLALPLVQPHPPACLHHRSLSRRVRSLQAVPQGGVLRTGEPVVDASALRAASSPTSPERSRVVSLVTSFGSCGPIYELPSMRLHQDRESEGFRGLFSRPGGVSLRIGSVGISRSAPPRTEVRPDKLGRELRSLSKAFLRRSESSVVCSRVRSICSRWCSICHSRLSMYCLCSSRLRKRAKFSPNKPCHQGLCTLS